MKFKGTPAPRRCSKAGCREFHPCSKPEHTWTWRKSTSQLPSNWVALVKSVKRKSGLFCNKCKVYAPNGQADHILNRARGGTSELSNLQWLCEGCHKEKTRQERLYGRYKKTKGEDL